MIENINLSDLENNQDLKKHFFTSNLNNLNERCTYFSGNFFLDPLNYYPITENLNHLINYLQELIKIQLLIIILLHFSII